LARRACPLLGQQTQTTSGKGYELTGDEFNIDEYNDEVQELDRWRGIKNALRPTFPPS